MAHCTGFLYTSSAPAAGVEGGTGTWPFAGAGAEIGFAGLPGVAVGSELLLAPLGDGGFGPGIRFAVRYYVW